jgi:hypothetical protein
MCLRFWKFFSLYHIVRVYYHLIIIIIVIIIICIWSIVV